MTDPDSFKDEPFGYGPDSIGVAVQRKMVILTVAFIRILKGLDKYISTEYEPPTLLNYDGSKYDGQAAESDVLRPGAVME